MIALKLNPLLKNNRVFERDFEAVLQNQGTLHALNPAFIQSKIAPFENTERLVMINGIASSEHSLFSDTIEVKNNVITITANCLKPIAIILMGDKVHETSLTIQLAPNACAEILYAFYSTTSSLGYYKFEFLCQNHSTLFAHYLQAIDEKATHIAEIVFSQATNSALFHSIGTIGGLRSGLLIENRLLGEHAEAKTTIISLQKSKNVSHITSYTRHSSAYSASEMEAKSLISDKARLQFLGKIDVDEPAHETNAKLRHQTILLSDTAEVSTEPQLEINNKNVKCAHGATVGQLDQNALFYLNARGIAESEAKTMLRQAFCEALIQDAKNTFWKETMLAELKAF